MKMNGIKKEMTECSLSASNNEIINDSENMELGDKTMKQRKGLKRNTIDKYYTKPTIAK